MSFKDPGNTIDKRTWKNPGLSQNPAPQANRNAPPSAKSDDYFKRGSEFSDSAVAGKNGIDHSDSSEGQYAYSLEQGLHNREEGTRQHEYDATADAEPLHPATVADVARGKYKGDEQQNGNAHKATGFGSDLGRGSQTRTGQGAKAKDANKVEE